MKLIYNVQDKPKFGNVIVFAIQQLLAIMAATLVVPVIINGSAVSLDGTVPTMSSAAALFGAGMGTLVYLLFTKFKSPVFLGSSFAFIGSMCSAVAGAATMALGYLGIIIGAIIAGLVYVVIAIVVKFVGVNWINKLMPAVVIGPTVAIIGLSLAGNAVGDMQKGAVLNAEGVQAASPLVCVLVGVVTLFVTILCSSYGKNMARLIPFILGILAGYAFATILTIIGNVAGVDAMKIISFDAFTSLFADGVKVKSFISLPDFTFLTAFGGFGDLTGGYVVSVAFAYAPVAFVVFAEHIADHKNLSSIIEKDLLEEPGLHRTLLGDGVGSMVGAFFGGCPNTTYGESVGCVAITRNASVVTILTTAIGAMIIACVSPFVAFVNTIPSCVMGGVCMALYGFIAVSGLRMFKNLDLDDNRNLFVVSTILIAGIGGLSITFNTNYGPITLTTIAVALILGIIVNLMLSPLDKKEK